MITSRGRWHPHRPGSPDGTQLAYTVQMGNRHDIWVLTPGGAPATAPLLDGPASEHSPAFSPDGRFVMVGQPNQRLTREIVLLRNWLGEQQRRAAAK